MRWRENGELTFTRRNLLYAGGAFGAGAILAAGLAPSAIAQANAWPDITALCDRYVSRMKVANMVAVMGWGQSPPETIARGALTLGAPDPAGADSLYRIYSMTKPVTGMAVMMLIDEGLIALDQPLAEILPKFADMKVQKIYDGGIMPDDLEPAKQPITFRHLLTHTAGLGYTIIQKGPIRKAYEVAGLVPGQVSRLPVTQIFGGGETVRSLELFADRLAEMPLVAQPGTRWSYSVAMDLLGRVIEVVSGQGFAEFLQEKLFDPIGMTSTWFEVPASETGRLTTNYFVMNDLLLPVDPPTYSVFSQPPAFPFGGAGLVSSPRDYDRFLQMLAGYGEVEGRRVMSERAVRTGTSNLLPEGVSTKGTFADGAGFGAAGRVGLGDEAGTYGWAGAAGTTGFVDMKRGLRAAVYTQYMPASAYNITREFAEAVKHDLQQMRAAA